MTIIKCNIRMQNLEQYLRFLYYGQIKSIYNSNGNKVTVTLYSLSKVNWFSACPVCNCVWHIPLYFSLDLYPVKNILIRFTISNFVMWLQMTTINGPEECKQLTYSLLEWCVGGYLIKMTYIAKYVSFLFAIYFNIMYVWVIIICNLLHNRTRVTFGESTFKRQIPKSEQINFFFLYYSHH